MVKQSRKSNLQTPEEAAKQIAATGEDAIEQVRQKTRPRSMAHLTVDDFIMNDPEEEVVKGSERGSGGWLHSPAHLELFTAADRRLTKVAARRGKVVKEVSKVRASLRKGSKELFIWPADDADDLSAIPVNRWESPAWINLISLLGSRQLSVRSGYRELHAIEYAPDDCPLGPCLMIDLGKIIERRAEPKKRKTAAAAATTSTSDSPAKVAKATDAAPATPAAVEVLAEAKIEPPEQQAENK
jgi:hypothetical protein